MKRIYVFLFVATTLLAQFAGPGTVMVRNQSGQRIWAALYIQHSLDARRIGQVRELSGDETFDLPPVDKDGRRYIFISRHKKLLTETINRPMDKVGIKRLAVGTVSFGRVQNLIIVDETNIPPDVQE